MRNYERNFPLWHWPAFFAGVSFMALGMSYCTKADAADIVAYKAQPYNAPPQGFNWSGIFFGVEAGFGWSANDPFNIAGTNTALFNLTNPGSLGPTASGGIIGVNLGLRAQQGPWVFGVKGQADLTGINSTNNPDALASTQAFNATGMSIPSVKTRLPWDTRFVGELGYVVMPQLLVGADAGGACGEIKTSTTATAANGNTVNTINSNVDNVHCGWTAGAFLEYSLTQSFTIGLQYEYIHLGTQGITLNGQPFTGANTMFNVTDKAAYNKALITLKFRN